MAFVFARGNGKPYLSMRKFLEELENEQEETRLRAECLATAVDNREVETGSDIWEEDMIDEHKYSGLLEEE